MDSGVQSLQRDTGVHPLQWKGDEGDHYSTARCQPNYSQSVVHQARKGGAGNTKAGNNTTLIKKQHQVSHYQQPCHCHLPCPKLASLSHSLLSFQITPQEELLSGVQHLDAGHYSLNQYHLEAQFLSSQNRQTEFQLYHLKQSQQSQLQYHPNQLKSSKMKAAAKSVIVPCMNLFPLWKGPRPYNSSTVLWELVLPDHDDWGLWKMERKSSKV